MTEILWSISKDLLGYLGSLIPIALTIYGFRLVYTEGNRLAKRNETFNLSQIGRQVLANISSESEAIWKQQSEVLAEADSAKLTAYVAEFEMCITQIRTHYGDVKISHRDIFGLRRALTAYPYLINGIKATNSERSKEIKALISELSLKLLDATFDNINNKFA